MDRAKIPIKQKTRFMLNMLPLIIGLEDRFRGRELETQLLTQGLQAERVAGVLLSELPEAENVYADQATARVLLRRNLTAGEIGCSLAHRAAYQRLLSSDCNFGLIFEDDARLQSPLQLDEITTHLESEEPRLILLDWNPGWTIVTGKKTSASSSIYYTDFAPIDARGYALNRAAARILLQDGARVSYVADWPAQVAVNVKFSVMYPRPVRADDTAPSSLEDGRQLQGKKQAEGLASKIVRFAETASHVRWLRHRNAYGTYRTYYHHELVRLPVYAIARKFNRRLKPGDSSSPLILRNVRVTLGEAE